MRYLQRIWSPQSNTKHDRLVIMKYQTPVTTIVSLHTANVVWLTQGALLDVDNLELGVSHRIAVRSLDSS